MWKSLDLFVSVFVFLLVFVGVFGVFYGKEDVMRDFTFYVSSLFYGILIMKFSKNIMDY